ncbi:GntR family transcriptional regulator [Luteimonas sp. BDR2-5]|uniref:GntR family transcriptional regulator n=1 Tax=Proluteimonas luteida TaxID=2878685 RepID=UPI001E32B30B|nr:GntR family transcriptional regulator [Luteimonas sp. BDR2-5]MCD9026771.1 GntR family transcriptional regulator [Luteimonas sp. BDR2-5]
MKTKPSKSVVLHDELRLALQSGRFVPGERIDPQALADEFRTSSTPVRFALHRLVGEGLIEDHAREGFHVPLPTELVLRYLYDWMERQLLAACDLGADPSRIDRMALDAPRPDDDIVLLTRRLFEQIARSTDHPFLYRAVRQANDWLAPTRHAKQGLLEHPFDEIAQLYRHWHSRDLSALRHALTGYHAHRKQLVPRIVASLNQAAAFFAQ